jgi:hypothetical protein
MAAFHLAAGTAHLVDRVGFVSMAREVVLPTEPREIVVNFQRERRNARRSVGHGYGKSRRLL